MATSERIVFIGAERVGLACLRRLRELNKNVVAAITAADALQEKIADWVAFDDFAKAADVPLYKVRSTRHEKTLKLVESLRPDLVCVVSWSMLIPPEILKIPPRGCVGFHYSMLPRRRGGAPLNWAIIDGLKETGVTLFYLDNGIDSGDVIDQQPFPIAETDTVKDLLDKILTIAPELLARHIDGILAGAAPRARQDESQATCTSRRRPEDGAIDWSRSEPELHDFIRALAPPYPCAFATVGRRKLVFTAAQLRDGLLRFEGHLE